MRKKLIYFSIFLMFLLCLIPTVNAATSYGKVNATLIVRSGPGTKYADVHNDLTAGTIVTITDTVNTDDINDRCLSKKWYKINNGYICTSFVDLIEVEEDVDFEATLNSFPKSYRDKLSILHSLHPTWIFKPVNTGLTLKEASYYESYGGRGLIQTSNEGWRSTTEDSGYDWETDYWPGKDGSSWKAASQDITAYYMDPRNFLSDNSIFQFAYLGFNPSQTEDKVQILLNSTTFMKGSYPYNDSNKTYASTFYEIGSSKSINPIYLAAKVVQEVGAGGSGSTSGKVTGYEGYYNFFNIGAYRCNHKDSNGECISTDPVINGLITAKKKGWTNPYLSISGGIEQTIAPVYIQKEATTMYFQKYNVNPDRWVYYPKYTIQYATNIMDADSVGKKLYNTYKEIDMVDNSFTFLIPVFTDSESYITKLPDPGNPNYYLKDLKVNGTTINGFTYNKAEYTITIPDTVKSISIDTTTINSTATVSGNGSVDISNKDKIKVIVTAGNKNTFTYTINLNKIETDIPVVPISEILDNSGVKYNDNYISGIKVGTNVSSLINNVKKSSSTATIEIIDSETNKTKTDSAFKTGDKVTIKSGDETKTYNIIIYGDVDGDGEIGRVDLLLVQRDVFGYAKLEGIYKEAADIDKTNDELGNKVGRVDLLLVQRDVFGYASIAQ